MQIDYWDRERTYCWHNFDNSTRVRRREAGSLCRRGYLCSESEKSSVVRVRLMTHVGRDSSRRPPLSNIICRNLKTRSVISGPKLSVHLDSECCDNLESDSDWRSQLRLV